MTASEKPGTPDADTLLTINGGSSSIRFALYSLDLRLLLDGKVDRVGLRGTCLTFTDVGHSGRSTTMNLDDGPDGRRAVATFLPGWLEARVTMASVQAIGHRVVHGMSRSTADRVTSGLLDELRRNQRYDPEHLPLELELIEAFRQRYPQLLQVACFDTAFHRSMPRVATLLSIPRRYQVEGVRRYGFHGLSYAYLMEELTSLGEPAAAAGRVILAHLGNGASLAAVHDGRSIDTSMGFTPAGGLMMSSRSGDLDPGLVSYLAQTEQMTAPRFQWMVNHESGLLGVSETSSDMRELLDREGGDKRAAEAIALFCYQLRKGIGAFAAALGGLDMLVFAGGIGENSPVIRERICSSLGFLGIELDLQRNTSGAPLISRDSGRVRVRVIRTDEQLMIARSTIAVISGTTGET